jgi:hypothetical protein
MFLQSLALAIGVASQRAFFQAPLQRASPEFLSATYATVPGPTQSVSPVPYFLEAEGEESSSWVGWSLLGATAVAGFALLQHESKTSTRATVAEQLMDGLAQHEASAAGFAMLAVTGSSQEPQPRRKFPMEQIRRARLWRIDDEQDDAGLDATEAVVTEKTEQTKEANQAMLAVAGEAEFDGAAYMSTLPGGFALAAFPGIKGAVPGSGFFDPWQFCSQDGITKGKVKLFREAELKHGRLGMLASVGFVVGEQWHPLFGGGIDTPSYLAFQQTPLQSFWPIVAFSLSIVEVFSVAKFNGPDTGDVWTIRDGEEPGDYGFDPLGLKPTDPVKLREMQDLELSTGRLGMVGIIGMISQELATGQKLFPDGIPGIPSFLR